MEFFFFLKVTNPLSCPHGPGLRMSGRDTGNTCSIVTSVLNMGEVSDSHLDNYIYRENPPFNLLVHVGLAHAHNTIT